MIRRRQHPHHPQQRQHYYPVPSTVSLRNAVLLSWPDDDAAGADDNDADAAAAADEDDSHRRQRQRHRRRHRHGHRPRVDGRQVMPRNARLEIYAAYRPDGVTSDLLAEIATGRSSSTGTEPEYEQQQQEEGEAAVVLHSQPLLPYGDGGGGDAIDGIDRTSPPPRLHPRWDNLDEVVCLFDSNQLPMLTDDEEERDGQDAQHGIGSSGASNKWRLDPEAWGALYRSLRVRVVASSAPSRGERGGEDGGPQDLGQLSSSSSFADADATVVVLADVPLHPTELRRLPNPITGSASSSPTAGGAGAGEPTLPEGERATATNGGGGDEFTVQGTQSRHYPSESPSSSSSPPPPTSPPSPSAPSSTAGLTVPSSLPPNSLLIHYTDGSTRIEPALYHRLVDWGVVVEPNSGGPRRKAERDKKARGFDGRGDERGGGETDRDVPEFLTEDRIQENLHTRRFDDDAFDMLGMGGNEVERGIEGAASGDGGGAPAGGAAAAAEAGRGAHVGGAMRSVVDDDVFDLLGDAATADLLGDAAAFGMKDAGEDDAGRGGGGSAQEERQLAEEAERQPVRASADGGDTNGDELGRHDDDRGGIEEEDVGPVDGGNSGSSPVVHLPTPSEVELDDLRCEVKELRTILEEEGRCLGRERDTLMVNMTHVFRSEVDEILHLEEETDLIIQDAAAEEEKLAKADFYLEARRVKLLRDLRTIYPIRSLPNQVYTIRGAVVPADLHSLAVPDAVVSAALGFVCHLVYMCSKYLSVPLRYRLFCNSSRSAVQDDGHGVYPLFRERVVEKEQFDRAVQLLGRNVECILRARGVEYVPRSHLLAKLDRLFVQTIEVAGPSCQ